jgi:hypothetical protein
MELRKPSRIQDGIYSGARHELSDFSHERRPFEIRFIDELLHYFLVSNNK